MKKRVITRTYPLRTQLQIRQDLYTNYRRLSQIFFEQYLDELKKVDPKLRKKVDHARSWGMSPERVFNLVENELDQDLRVAQTEGDIAPCL